MNEQLNELRRSCLESVSLNATLAPGIHVKQIGYEICKRWLEGGQYPLDEIPTGHIMESGRNSGPEFEKGVLMALDEIAEHKPLSVWIDPEFIQYLEESEPPIKLNIIKERERTLIVPLHFSGLSCLSIVPLWSTVTLYLFGRC